MKNCETCRFWRRGRTKGGLLGTCMAAMERARAIVPASINLDVSKMYGWGGGDCPTYEDKQVAPTLPADMVLIPRPVLDRTGDKAMLKFVLEVIKGAAHAPDCAMNCDGVRNPMCSCGWPEKLHKAETWLETCL